MPIEIENVDYLYQKGTPFQRMALKNVSLTIKDAQIIGVMGETGSGKSTLLQLLNGLLLPSSGRVLVDGKDTNNLSRRELIQLRQKVGLVLQNPEQQIFEITVKDEVGFGPRNVGLDDTEVEKRVEEALVSIGLSYDDFKGRPTNSLSSGEKRRVAIAGILALNPQYLLLDEPTAGLDLEGRNSLLQHLINLNSQKGTTIVIISHDPSYLLEICQKIYILQHGSICVEFSGETVKTKLEDIETLGFTLPDYLKLIYMLEQKEWCKAIPYRSRQKIIEQVASCINHKL